MISLIRFKIPDNIEEFARTRPSRIEFSRGYCSAINEYGTLEVDCVKVLILASWCRCGYHSLFNREMWEIPNPMHQRHTYTERYEWVFAWQPDSGIPLESAFDTWLKENQRAIKGYESYKRGRYL